MAAGMSCTTQVIDVLFTMEVIRRAAVEATQLTLLGTSPVVALVSDRQVMVMRTAAGLIAAIQAAGVATQMCLHSTVVVPIMSRC